MVETAIRSIPTDSGQDIPIVISQLPISARERRIAFGILAVIIVTDALAVTFGHIQLARIGAFIPVVQTVMCVVDLMTATLLFAQYSIHPERAVLAVASAYIFSGLFAFIQTLAFPGAYLPSAVVGDGINSAAWFFVFWHTTFPLTLMFYALSKVQSHTASPGGSIAARIFTTVAGVLIATIALSWLAISGVGYLPVMYINIARQTHFASYIDVALWALNVTVFVLLFVRRRTVLDLWILVVLCAWWPNFLVAAFYDVVRFSAGWYLARAVALIASSTLLIVLLIENAALHKRLTNAYLLLRRERINRLSGVETATAAMAHELRQPLAGIASRGAAGLNWLKRAPPELKKVRESLESMVSASLRADEIITDISGLVKRIPVQHTTFQLNGVVREVLDLLRDDLRAQAITSTAECARNLPDIYAARTQIQQVVFNLAKNAIEAMRSVSPGKRRLKLTTALSGKSDVSIYVEDSGPGIGTDDRDRIFDPLFTTKQDGMGLGLAICRTIVESHGGQLRLAKTDPNGASFELILPIRPSTGVSA